MNTKNKITTIAFNPSFLFLFFLIVQILIIIYYGNKKLNLFGDEIWTFNLANHYFEPFLGDASKYYNRWLDYNFWNQVITVLPEHRFSFASVFYNQAQDVHPPFYYIVIHTICSFFPKEFSKWFGIVPNIIFFIITQFILWFSAKKIFSSKWTSLLICSFYGFSWGTINNVLYVRMYAMLTLWAIISYVLHLKLINSFDYKCYITILFISFCGVMTQYYFLIYEFFVSLGFCVILILRKEYKFFILYMLGFIILLAAIVNFYPPIVDQLLGKVGNQGQTAMQNMMGSNFSHRISVFGHVISKDLFGAHIVLVFTAITLMFLKKLFSRFCELLFEKYNDKIRVKFTVHSASIETTIRLDYLKIYMIYSLFLSFGYFCVIAKIAPYLESRYLVIIYPIIIILFVYILKKIQEIYQFSRRSFVIACFILLSLFSIKMYHADNLFSYDKNYKNINQIITQQNANVVFILVTKEKTWWPTMNEVLTLRKVKASYMIREDEIDSLPNILEKYRENHSTVLLYRGFDCQIAEDEFIKKIKTEFTDASMKKMDDYMGQVYLLE